MLNIFKIYKENKILKKNIVILNERINELNKNNKFVKSVIHNPYQILLSIYPNLGIKNLDIQIDKKGMLIRDQDNYLIKLNKEERIEYLKEIDRIWKNNIFKKEIEMMEKDIMKEKILADDTSDKGRLLLQLLLFISGIKTRFKMMSNLYIQEINKQKLSDDNEKTYNIR